MVKWKNLEKNSSKRTVFFCLIILLNVSNVENVRKNKLSL